MRARTLWLAIMWAAAGAGAGGGPAPTVYNGGLEMDSPQAPPPGWAMWGAQRYKDPANYTRDGRDPHGGSACLRIHHPADTGGYLVTDPAHALRPRRGMMLTVTFWARTDRPGRSVFGFTAYESIQPFVDAPSPGLSALDTDTRWRRFAFTVREGWDLFAERSRYLLLTFKATDDDREERTLWVDDVSVEERPCDRSGRLVDADRLAHAPLQHRLRPGDRMAITVDAGKRVGKATRSAGGVSFHRVAGWTGQPYDRRGAYTLDPQVERAIREMRLPMTRFYGVGDAPFGVTGAVDRAAAVCRRVGVPLEQVVLELETQDASTKIPPETWARAARHALSRGYGFRRWEVANEPYASIWQGGARMGAAFPSPDAYVEHVRAVSAAVRRVQPNAQIGIAVAVDNQAWCSYVLKQAAGAYDFVVGHYYTGWNATGRRLEPLALTENYRTLDTILRINALIRAYNPGRKVYQLDTEWGMHSMGPGGERADYVARNANMVGTLHRAVRLIYYVREGMLRGASSWQMLSNLDGPGFGILSQQAPSKRFLLYWLYYLLNRHVGEDVVELTGTAPWYAPGRGEDPGFAAGAYPGPLTPAVATLSADRRRVALVAANGSSTRAVPCRVALRRFAVGRAEAVVLQQPDLGGSPLIERREDAIVTLPITAAGGVLTFTLPPHSVVFVTIRRR